MAKVADGSCASASRKAMCPAATKAAVADVAVGVATDGSGSTGPATGDGRVCGIRTRMRAAVAGTRSTSHRGRSRIPGRLSLGPEPVSAWEVPGPAAVAPRPGLVLGLAAVPVATGPARRTAVDGSTHRIAPLLQRCGLGLYLPPAGPSPGARHLLATVRTHRDIKNGLHRVLDVAFREDESRSPRAPQPMPAEAHGTQPASAGHHRPGRGGHPPPQGRPHSHLHGASARANAKSVSEQCRGQDPGATSELSVRGQCPAPA